MKYYSSQKFGQIIKSLRKVNDLNQDDLAEFLGITRSAYSGMENGKYGPSLDTLIGIYMFYNKRGIRITTDYLLGLIDKYGREIDQELNILKSENELKDREMGHLRKHVEQLEKIVKLYESGGKLDNL